jgi:hypothetical protein
MERINFESCLRNPFPNEIETVTLAVKAIQKEKGLTINICPRTAEELVDPTCLEDFIQLPKLPCVDYASNGRQKGLCWL